MGPVLVIGGLGFLGANFIRHHLAGHPGVSVWNLDRLDRQANPENLRDVECREEYRFVAGDVADRETLSGLVARGVEAIVNFAGQDAPSGPAGPALDVVHTNLAGVQNLLEVAVERGVARVLQVSTAAVYGPAPPTRPADEATLPEPANPHLASRAGGDWLALGAARAFGLEVMVARPTRVFGPHQPAWEPVARAAVAALEAAGEERPVTAESLGLSLGAGDVWDWLYVADCCEALDAVLYRGEPGAVYNVASHMLRSEAEMVAAVLRRLGVALGPGEPAGGRRRPPEFHAVDGRRIRQGLGWWPRWSLDDALTATVEWYGRHPSWWSRMRAGEHIRLDAAPAGQAVRRDPAVPSRGPG